jgi:hypothetical protein
VLIRTISFPELRRIIPLIWFSRAVKLPVIVMLHVFIRKEEREEKDTVVIPIQKNGIEEMLIGLAVVRILWLS